MLRLLFLLQLTFGLIFSGIVYLVGGTIEAISFLAGAIFATINTLFLVFIVTRLFRKKSVALTFILIIFKYTIFGLGLYFLVTSKLLIVSWFVVGLSILLPTIIGLVVMHIKKVKQDEANQKETGKERDKTSYGTF